MNQNFREYRLYEPIALARKATETNLYSRLRAKVDFSREDLGNLLNDPECIHAFSQAVEYTYTSKKIKKFLEQINYDCWRLRLIPGQEGVHLAAKSKYDHGYLSLGVFVTWK